MFNSSKSPFETSRIEQALALAAVIGVAAVGAAKSSAETATGKSPISGTEAHMLKISNDARKMLAQGNHSAYQEPVTANGKPLRFKGHAITRLVVAVKQPRTAGRPVLYDQLVSQFIGKQKKPYLMSLVTGTPQNRFKLGERFEYRQTLNLTDTNPRTYHWAGDKTVDSQGRVKTASFDIHATDPDNPITELLVQDLDDFTSQAEGLVEQAASQPGQPTA